MSVTKEQAEFFYKIHDLGTWEPNEHVEAIGIAAEMLSESQGEIDNLTDQLASQTSASTRNNHLRVKELEEQLVEQAKVIDQLMAKLK